MRVLTHGELMSMTRTELMALLRRIASELPNLREGSAELRDAHSNLQNIRRVLAPAGWPGPTAVSAAQPRILETACAVPFTPLPGREESRQSQARVRSDPR